jgi:manganese/zinc/iron transport system substrate-binding protein
MQVEALQGISTVADFGIAEVNNLVNLIIEKKIPAVFIETSVSPKAIEAVMAGCDSKGFKVKKGGSLFSDALGDPGTVSGTYIGMVKTNVSTIVKALR